jgi:hypothetical protein
MIKGNLQPGSSFLTQLFSGNVPLRDQCLYISYSVSTIFTIPES